MRYVSVTFSFSLLYLQCHVFPKLSLATTIAILTHVQCYYMTSFNYVGKKVRDVGLTCRFNLSNIISGSIFYDSINHFHNVLKLFSCFTKLFFTMKRRTINTYKHGKYESRVAERLNIGSEEIRKNQKSLKTSQNDSLVPSLPAKMKILLILAKKLFKNRY